MRSFVRYCCPIGILAIAGCVTPWNTRLPQFQPGSPVAEKHAFQRHDPFPDEDIGPDTGVRPRAFSTQRTEPRRLFDEQLRWGYQRQAGVPTTTPAPLPPDYSNAVRP